MMEQAVSKQKMKENDKERRDFNVIIYGAEESKLMTDKLRREEDAKFCKTLCADILEVHGEIVEVTRLGRYDNTKLRPLRVTFLDQQQARKVHANAYKLRDVSNGPFCKISISHDLTQDEREELRNLVQETKNLTTQDTSGRWEYKVRSAGPIWNPKIRKLKRREESGNQIPANNSRETHRVERRDSHKTEATQEDQMGATEGAPRVQ
jgi:hypothetical protein